MSAKGTELHKGTHLLVDCRNVPVETCLNDRQMLKAMAAAAERAGANVISQVRYHFGHNSPPGFTAVVVLDESHCSVHTYAERQLLAPDLFTCGNTNPRDVLRYIQEEIDLGTDITVTQMPRFVVSADDETPVLAGSTAEYAQR
jgi:S-adenosylmethionine decarboxylase